MCEFNSLCSWGNHVSIFCSVALDYSAWSIVGIADVIYRF